MGGFGSGRRGGRATIESALKLDVDAMIRARQPGAHVGGEMKFRLDDDELRIQRPLLDGREHDSMLICCGLESRRRKLTLECDG